MHRSHCFFSSVLKLPSVQGGGEEGGGNKGRESENDGRSGGRRNRRRQNHTFRGREELNFSQERTEETHKLMGNPATGRKNNGD